MRTGYEATRPRPVGPHGRHPGVTAGGRSLSILGDSLREPLGGRPSVAESCQICVELRGPCKELVSHARAEVLSARCSPLVSQSSVGRMSHSHSQHALPRRALRYPVSCSPSEGENTSTCEKQGPKTWIRKKFGPADRGTSLCCSRASCVLEFRDPCCLRYRNDGRHTCEARGDPSLWFGRTSTPPLHGATMLCSAWASSARSFREFCVFSMNRIIQKQPRSMRKRQLTLHASRQEPSPDAQTQPRTVSMSLHPGSIRSTSGRSGVHPESIRADPPPGRAPITTCGSRAAAWIASSKLPQLSSTPGDAIFRAPRAGFAGPRTRAHARFVRARALRVTARWWQWRARARVRELEGSATKTRPTRQKSGTPGIWSKRVQSGLRRCNTRQAQPKNGQRQLA